MLKHRHIVIQAVAKMCRALELDDIQGADHWWNTAIKADLVYMKMWNDPERTVADILVNTASEYEKKGDKVRAEDCMDYAELTDKKYEITV